MRLFALLLPVALVSLGSVACSFDSPEPTDPPKTDDVQQNQLVAEGQECSVEDKCQAGLVCVARVKGGDLGTKGVPCGDCGETSSSSSSTGGSTTSSSSSGWSSSSTSSGWTGSSTSSGVTSSSSSSGWSSSSSSSGWSSSSSSGAPLEVGICMRVR